MSGVWEGTAAWIADISPIILGPPMAVGCWCQPRGNIGNSTMTPVFGLSDTGTDTNYFLLGKNTSDIPAITVSETAGNTAAALTTAMVANQWYYLIGRFISATNYRISCLYPDGHIEHAAGSTSRTPTGIDRRGIGAMDRATLTHRWFGYMAEWWQTDADIQADGGQLDDGLVRHLAANGPFSIPAIGSSIMDYYGMRQSHPRFPDPRDTYFRSGTPKVMVEGGGATAVTLGAQHPPVGLPRGFPRNPLRALPV